MINKAGIVGISRRPTVAIISLSSLVLIAAMASGGSVFRDIQAALVVGIIGVLLLLLSSGISIRKSIVNYALAVFLLVNIFALLLSVWKAESALEVGLIGSYMLVLLSASSASNRNLMRLAAHLLTAAGAGIAVFGLAKYFSGAESEVEALKATGFAAEARQLAAMADRASANFVSANSFAGFLILLIPLAIGLWFFERDIKLRIWLGVALAIMSTALFYTFSKGGILALSLSLIVMLAGGAKTKPKLRVPMLALAGAAGVGVPLYIFRFFFNNNWIAVVGNVAGRVELWSDAWHIFRTHPILGVGPGAFGTALVRFQSSSVYSPYVHNTYLQIAAETGIAGFMTFILAMLFLLILVWRRAGMAMGRERWLHLSFLAALTGFLVHNAVDYTWFVPGVALLFWLIAGLALAPVENAQPISVKPTVYRYGLIGILGVLIIPILLVYLSVSFTAQGDILRNPSSYRLSDARDLYILALRLFPANTAAHDGLAQTYYMKAVIDKERTIPDAIREEREAIKLRPTWPHYHSRLAGYLALNLEDREALSEHERAVFLYPIDPATRVRAGNFLLRKRRFDDALTMFRTAADLKKVYRIDDTTGATAASLENAREDERAPGMSIGNALVGEAKSQLALRRYDAAQGALLKAENLLGHTAEIYTLRGSILEVQGSYKAAAAAYRQAAVANGFADPNVFYRLARALLKTGRRTDAILELQKINEFAPKFRPASDLLRQLTTSGGA